jgi:hypothetical protein
VHMAGSNMQFDDLMSQDEWANSFLDPTLGLNNGQVYGGRAPYGASAQGMGGWR